MAKLILDISISLDGFVAGPNQTLDQPLGEGGDHLHNWLLPLATLQARAAAGDKDVGVAGGASVTQQYLAAGLLDEFQIHVAPMLLGGGVRLFDGLPHGQIELECIRVIESPAVTHLKYRVVK